MSFRSRSVMQNTPTTSIQSDDNNNELVNTIGVLLKKNLKNMRKKLIRFQNPNYKTLMNA